MLSFLKKRWVYHTLTWVIGIVTIEAIAWIPVEEGEYFDHVGVTIAYILPLIPIVYLNFFLKKTLYDRRKYWQYFSSIPFQVVIGVLYYRIVCHFVVNTSQSWQQDASNVFFVIALTTGIQYFKRGVVNQYQLQELRNKNTMMELNALRAQVNPHFLFNNLNNIYAINNIDASKGSEMLLELAEVMRYHLEFSRLEKIKVCDEVQLIRSYIELERLRLNELCDLDTSFLLAEEEMHIAPLLLLPFIENAFKHGTHPNKKCFVRIELELNDRKLNFHVSNSIIPRKQVVQTRMGQENTQRRLELIYPERHQLEIRNTGIEYHVNLQIDL
ncbi:MAG: histidine kinase [Flavobacteriales bacterium]|nr:histidine kinase [Flavobacteriales bacterium]